MSIMLPVSLPELISRHQSGESFQFLHFWGHRSTRDGRITSSCFSQWFPAHFTENGQHYPSAEHYMMAAKARLFGDDICVQKILANPDPSAAKALGRTVQGFTEELWLAEREQIVLQASLLKFAQNPAMLAFLMASKGKVLVEASPLDRIWGIGLSATDTAANHPEQWQGLNLLGFALMKARNQLTTQ